MRLGSPSGVPGLRCAAVCGLPSRFTRPMSTERSFGALDQTPGVVDGDVPANAPPQLEEPGLRSALTFRPPNPQSAERLVEREPPSARSSSVRPTVRSAASVPPSASLSVLPSVPSFVPIHPKRDRQSLEVASRSRKRRRLVALPCLVPWVASCYSPDSTRRVDSAPRARAPLPPPAVAAEPWAHPDATHPTYSARRCLSSDHRPTHRRSRGEDACGLCAVGSGGATL